MPRMPRSRHKFHRGGLFLSFRLLFCGCRFRVGRSVSGGAPVSCVSGSFRRGIGNLGVFGVFPVFSIFSAFRRRCPCARVPTSRLPLARLPASRYPGLSAPAPRLLRACPLSPTSRHPLARLSGLPISWPLRTRTPASPLPCPPRLLLPSVSPPPRLPVSRKG